MGREKNALGERKIDARSRTTEREKERKENRVDAGASEWI